jgi:D-amino-acid dehydrogenase
VFYNTGHGHLGWTLSAATAEIVAEAVLQRLPSKRVHVGASSRVRMDTPA